MVNCDSRREQSWAKRKRLKFSALSCNATLRSSMKALECVVSNYRALCFSASAAVRQVVDKAECRHAHAYAAFVSEGNKIVSLGQNKIFQFVVFDSRACFGSGVPGALAAFLHIFLSVEWHVRTSVIALGVSWRTMSARSPAFAKTMLRTSSFAFTPANLAIRVHCCTSGSAIGEPSGRR